VSNDFNIKNIAKLASINLSEEEQESLSNDLNIILEHVNALSNLKLNSDQQEIYIHPLEKELVLQEDEVVESLTHDEAISNAPKSEDGKFVVPPSME
tara:strand:+ start:212 stop:502 length:291 start_codon:yes stop_codon:yes gene_type:complete